MTNAAPHELPHYDSKSHLSPELSGTPLPIHTRTNKARHTFPRRSTIRRTINKLCDDHQHASFTSYEDTHLIAALPAHIKTNTVEEVPGALSPLRQDLPKAPREGGCALPLHCTWLRVEIREVEWRARFVEELGCGGQLAVQGLPFKVRVQGRYMR